MAIHLAAPVAVASIPGRPADRPASGLGVPITLLGGGALTMAGIGLRPRFWGSEADGYVQLAFSRAFVLADLALLAGALLVASSEWSLSTPAVRRSTVAVIRAVALLGCLLVAAQVVVELVALRGAAVALVHAPSTNGIVDLPVSRDADAFRAAASISGIATALRQGAAVVFGGAAPLLTVLVLGRVPGVPLFLTAVGSIGCALGVGTGVLALLDGDAPILTTASTVGTVLAVGCLVITGLWSAAAGPAACAPAPRFDAE